MAQRSARRGRDNQRNPECFQHATGVMDPARELPYRPAADHRRIRGRTDGSIRLRATTILKFSLAWEGVSTDGFRSFTATTAKARSRQYRPFAGALPKPPESPQSGRSFGPTGGALSGAENGNSLIVH